MGRKASSPSGLPAEIVVAHATYGIAYDDAGCDEADSDGLMEVGQRAIRLRSGLVADYEREVLLHEALHACVGVTALDMDADTEETIVAALTGPLLGLLRQNPHLVDYLLA